MQTFTGKQYLMIDIANNFGLDKLNWNERLEWFDKNQHNLTDLIHQAESPALFFAGIKAWDTMLQGKPSGYPISLDATSSGLQILAALTGDRLAASLCNVVNTGKREDAYTNIFVKMVDYLIHRLGEHAGGIKRDDCKQAIMTSLYGSQAVPKEVFGEGVQLSIFYEVMAELAPAAWELNEAFLGMWRPDVLEHSWVLPDNFHVHIKVVDTIKEVVHFQNRPYDTFYKINQPKENGRSIGANVVHSLDGMIVRELTRRCMFNPDQIFEVIGVLNKDDSFKGTNLVTEDDKMVLTLWQHYQQSGYLSARIFDHITAENVGHITDEEIIWDLIWSLPEKPFEVVAVHDCFRCLPNYGDDLRKQYNIQLAELAKSNMLQFLIRQITGNPSLNIGKLDNSMWLEVLDADYALS
jgi:hypothetical protein